MIKVMTFVLAAAAVAAPIPASDPATWTPELRKTIEKLLDRAEVNPRRLTPAEREALRARGGPVPLSEGVPWYPRHDLKEDVYGCVVVSFEIRHDGRTDGYEVVSANPPGVFDKMALRMMLVTRFEATGRAAAGAEPQRHRRGVFVLLPRPAPATYSPANKRAEAERNVKRGELRAACEAGTS